MKRFKVVGLCLVAVFALSAIVASAASAASPEYFLCVKAKGAGKYEDKACSKEAVPGPGNYERKAGIEGAKKTAFKGKNEGNPHNNIVNPFGKEKKVGEPGTIEGTTTCEKEKVAGTTTGGKTATWKTTFGKCSALESKCFTTGQKEGTIITDQLSSTLVWLDKGHTKAGISVTGAGPESPVAKALGLGGRLAEYHCLGGALNVEVFGNILAEVQGNVGAASKSTKDVANEGPLHLQGPEGGGGYAEEPFGSFGNDEQAGKGWWEYEEGLLACEAGKEPFPPGPHTQAECELFLGGPNPVPVKPAYLVSVVTGAKEGLAPGIQNGVSNIKGEAFGIA